MSSKNGSGVTLFRGIEIPKIMKKFNLGEYSTGMKSLTFHVWVNLPRAMHNRWEEIMKRSISIQLETSKAAEALEKATKEKGAETDEVKAAIEQLKSVEKQSSLSNRELFSWYSDIWLFDQGSGPEEITTEEVKQLADDLAENDMNLWKWICKSTQLKIIEQSNQHLKNLIKRS